MGQNNLWNMAFGLQDVDGLKPSKFLIDKVKEDIGIKEIRNIIIDHYRNIDNRTKEADIVSIGIVEVLSEDTFTFSPTELLNIHKKLFTGVFDGGGGYRDYNITKDEWILNEDTVIYSSYENIVPSLAYDFEQERNFSYKNLNISDSIKHLSRFISNIWQIHPFGEGNTRTIAVFLIKYLRSLGFDINYKVFEKNSWYFRNALARANYKNYEKNIFEDTSYLEKFLYNLLTGADYELNNSDMKLPM